MTTLFETLLNGKPIDIRKSIFESLDVKAESLLKEEHKIVIAKVFSEPYVIKEQVQRKPWNKTTIREALEAAAVKKLERDNLNENYSKINHMHDVALQHGFVHESSHPGKGGHINHYSHPSGKHSCTICSPSQDYELILGGGTHLTGNGHTDFKHHLKHLNEYD